MNKEVFVYGMTPSDRMALKAMSRDLDLSESVIMRSLLRRAWEAFRLHNEPLHKWRERLEK